MPNSQQDDHTEVRPRRREYGNIPPWTEEEERQIEMSAESRRRAAKKIREDVAAETEELERTRPPKKTHRELF